MSSSAVSVNDRVIHVEPITFCIIILVVCVATFVCTVLGKYCMDFINLKQRYRVRTCKKCRLVREVYNFEPLSG